MHLHGVMVMTLRDRRTLDVLAYSGFPRWNAETVQVNERRLCAIPHKPMALDDVMEHGSDVVELRMPFAERFGVVLILPIHSEEGDLLGLLVLGNKRTGTRFTHEDMDLLHSLTNQAGLHLERLRLQQTLLLEKEEAARLRELSQMKSYFVSGVSHDLKTPLTSIKLFAELLEEQVPDDDNGAKKYVGIIQGECDRLARLINNVLDFTKIERGMMKYRLTKTDLNDVIRRSWDVMQYQFSMGGCTCALEVCEEPVFVHGDADALIEAVTNLLSNAMKYSGKGKSIAMRSRRDGTRVFLDVEDQGLGIALEEQPRLFEPFYRSHTGDVQKHGGVGLGLALVKHIIDAHDGQVQVQSTLGKGSIFTISFHAMEAV
jgi:signal transduction histidine kinase